MHIFPSESEFIELSKQGNLIPVYTDLMADQTTPVAVYSKLNAKSPAFLFESVEGGEHISRYSFTGSQPRMVIQAFAEQTKITDAHGHTRVLETPQDPLQLVEQEMAKFQPVEFDDMPPFHGGAVGYVGYEYIHRIEPSVQPARTDELETPLLYYAIMDTVVIFDHAKQILRVCSNAHVQASDPQSAYATAVQQIEQTLKTIQTPLPHQTLNHIPDYNRDIVVPPGNFTQPEFEALVATTQAYIKAGDVIQVVGSQRFKKPNNHPPLSLYRALRLVNPSPYMFILETPEFSLVGASPEVHVRNTHGLVEIRPIAGTRPRGKNEAEDRALEKDLLADTKECAEHLMLVDLARNDIGRVCQIGSIKVNEYATIERYSHVMHIVSQVEGRLSADKNAYDLMRATFPAGTLSGAPKIRAMQIIAELEPSQRGPYAGALGYFGYNGNLDCCIAIRTALLKDETLYIQSGAGLVADSIPKNEYEETLNKASGMLKAVALSEEIVENDG